MSAAVRVCRHQQWGQDVSAVLLDERKHVYAQPDVHTDVSGWLHARLEQDVYAVSSRKLYELGWSVCTVRAGIDVISRIVVL